MCRGAAGRVVAACRMRLYPDEGVRVKAFYTGWAKVPITTPMQMSAMKKATRSIKKPRMGVL